MPILESAKKALRASKRKAVYNQTVRSRAKSAVETLKKNPSMEALSEAYSAIDMAVKRNLYHQNKAARLKAQLSKLVKPTKLAKPAKKTKTASKKKAKSTTKKSKKTAKPKKK